MKNSLQTLRSRCVLFYARSLNIRFTLFTSHQPRKMPRFSFAESKPLDGFVPYYVCDWCDMAGQTIPCHAMPNHPGRRYISRDSDPVGGKNIEFWLPRLTVSRFQIDFGFTLICTLLYQGKGAGVGGGSKIERKGQIDHISGRRE